jgi:hypothetical protein
VRTALGGRYAYQCAVRLSPNAKLTGALLATDIQLNPRTLPELAPGHNGIVYSAARRHWRALPLEAAHAARWALRSGGARFETDGAQGYWLPAGTDAAEFVFRLGDPGGRPLTSISAGGRFLDLSQGIAPDKFTAEIRTVLSVRSAAPPTASIAWSHAAQGPYTTLWEFDPRLSWRDGQRPDRVLAWPEIDRTAAVNGAKEIFVRYRFSGLAVDDFRLAAESAADGKPCAVHVTHVWKEDGAGRRHAERIPAGVLQRRYAVETRPGARIENVALEMECRP